MINNDFNGRLESISMLRIICAFGVAISHMPILKDVGIHFSAGVEIFFCITGFLTLYTTSKKKPEHFLIKKFSRLLPLYWLLTIMTFVAMFIIPSMKMEGVGIIEVLKSMFFIPVVRNSLQDGMVIRPIVGPAWSLYFDIYFLVIFYICMQISYEYRGLIALAVTSILFICSLCFQPENAFLVVLFRYRWIFFITGMLCYYLLRKVWDCPILQSRITRAVLLVIGIVTLAFYYVDAFKYTYLAVAVIFCCFVLAFRKSAIPHCLCVLADISFSFYLIHYFVILALDMVIPLDANNVLSLVGILLVFLISIVCAKISFVWIENKFGNLILSKVLRKNIS